MVVFWIWIEIWSIILIHTTIFILCSFNGLYFIELLLYKILLFNKITHARIFIRHCLTLPSLLRSFPLTSIRRSLYPSRIVLVFKPPSKTPNLFFRPFTPQGQSSFAHSSNTLRSPCCCAPAVLPLWFCSLDPLLLYTLSLKHPLLLSGKVPSYSAFTFTHPPHFVTMIRSSSSSLSALFCVPSACASSFHLASINMLYGLKMEYSPLFASVTMELI